MPTLIDPQQIYPKRMGLYKGAIVIEYYNLEKDCIKKHFIPFDGSENPQKIVQSILKNPKHSVFLRKVSPNYIKSVVSGGHFDVLPSNINDRSSKFNPSYNEFSEQHSGGYTDPSCTFNNNTSSSGRNASSRQNRTNSYTTSNERLYNTGSYQSSSLNTEKSSLFSKKKDIDESESYNLSTSKVNTSKIWDKNKDNFEDSHGYSMNFDQESMNISVVPIKDVPQNQHVIEEQIDYYDEDFEQLSAEKIEPPKPKQKEKQNEKEKAKQQKKKSKEKKVEIPDEFQFLNEEEQPDKKKKKKKDKSKEKMSKKKSKEKQSSQQPSKQPSVKEEIPIQQQFDFI